MFNLNFIIEALLLGLALSMDCFTVSITCGLQGTMTRKRTLFLAFSFGFFQALMPFLGSILGDYFKTIIEDITPWIAFALLAVIGLKMIIEAKNYKMKDKIFDISQMKVILMLSIATSIDAFVVGIGFSMKYLIGQQLAAIIIIFLITFIMSIVGAYMGKRAYFIKPRLALFLGGLILMLIGLKTLAEHYFF
jgi:putative Mn2+ efflux pump MntP